MKLTARRASGKIGASMEILLAKDLYREGMCPTYVRCLTGIRERDSYDVYQEVFDRRPTTGKVPSNPNYCVTNHLTQYHASVAYVIFDRIRNASPDGTSPGRILLETYRMYRDLALKNRHDYDVFDIDRLYVLMNAIETGVLVVRKCSCDATYVAAHWSPNKCPVCASIRRERCSHCATPFVFSTMIPRDTPGRYSSLCENCKANGYRPKRKARSSSSAVYANGASLLDWGYSPSI